MRGLAFRQTDFERISSRNGTNCLLNSSFVVFCELLQQHILTYTVSYEKILSAL